MGYFRSHLVPLKLCFPSFFQTQDVGPIGPDSAVYHRNKRYWNSGRFTVPPYCPPGCSDSNTPPTRPTECPPGSPGCDRTDSQMPPTRCPQGSPGCATKCLPGQPGCDSQNGGNPVSFFLFLNCFYFYDCNFRASGAV